MSTTTTQRAARIERDRAIVGRLLEGRSHREIADEFGVSTKTVSRAKRRAMEPPPVAVVLVPERPDVVREIAARLAGDATLNVAIWRAPREQETSAA